MRRAVEFSFSFPLFSNDRRVTVAFGPSHDDVIRHGVSAVPGGWWAAATVIGYRGVTGQRRAVSWSETSVLRSRFVRLRPGRVQPEPG